MGLTRRQLLAGTAGGVVLAAAGCTRGAPSGSAASGSAASGSAASGVGGQTAAVTPTPTRSAYGAAQYQFGDLYRPSGAAHPGVIVVIHGGFWRSQYDLTLGAPLALDLAARGYLTWNLEYRRVGDGGGWPNTLADVAAGIDHLATLGVDTSRVVAVGHSAGGQLAAWAAGRAHLPAGAPGVKPTVAVTGVVSQAGVLDLITAADSGVGATAVPDLLGGTPREVPERYRIADPIQQLPAPVPVLCVHSAADQIVPLAQSVAYVAAATRAGGRATLAQVAGDHFTLIDTKSAAWATVVDALPTLLT